MFLKKNNFIKKQNYSVLKGSSNQHKKNLLEEQLSLVDQKEFSADKVFELNKNYGLEDNKKH